MTYHCGMSESGKSITDQLREAIDGAGGQAEVYRRILASGASFRKPTLSEVYTGQRPSLETLVAVARATGYRFDIGGDTEIGTSRASRPSEEAGGAAEASRASRGRKAAT